MTTTIPERVWRDPYEKMLERSAVEGDCLVWMGARRTAGYGVITIAKGRVNGTHRVAWEHFHGSIPKGLCVLHSCDNPPCFKIEHLRLGTHADNAADKVARNRQVHMRGERCGVAKYSDEQVEDLLVLFAAGASVVEAAERVGITRQMAFSIVAGSRRAHQIPEELVGLASRRRTKRWRDERRAVAVLWSQGVPIAAIAADRGVKPGAIRQAIAKFKREEPDETARLLQGIMT